MVAVDVYFNDVTLLLHGEGTNGSSTITDSSKDGRTPITNSGCTISTSQHWLGSASISIPTASNYLEYDDIHLHSRNFTVELAVYFLSFSANQIVVSTYNISYGQGGAFLVYTDTSGNIRISDGATEFTSPTTLSVNTWYQLGITYNNSTGDMKLYINNVLDYTGTSFNVYNTSASHLFLGTSTGDNNTGTWYFTGYIDEFRITYDQIRTTVTTTQTAPFPDGSSYVPVSLTESITANDFITRIYNLQTGILNKTVNITSGTTNIFLNTLEPLLITVLPIQGDVWKPSHSYTTNDLVFPTTVETTNYYYKLTNTGTSSATEPTWGTTIGGTTTDLAGRTYECIAKITQPITQSPIVPYIV